VRRHVASGSIGLLVILLVASVSEAACTVSATAVNFGAYMVFSTAPTDGTGTVSLRCGKDKDISISLDRGGAPSFAARRLTKGAETLGYNLYRDAARTIVWGDGSGGTQTYVNANPPDNQTVDVPIYGRIPAGQDVSVGTYTNTIAVTINF
jgi:spore coat protein U-like protein